MNELHQQIASIRKDYISAHLTEDSIDKNPFQQFKKWIQQAITAKVNEPNAMCLSTVSKTGKPSSRIVLLRGFDENGFVFYTNYNSRKSNEITEHDAVAINMFWPELEKQIRIEGSISKVSTAQSDTYFENRPRESKLGAWASAQSEILMNRADIDNKLKAIEDKFKDMPIPRPAHWGGYCIKPDYMEFWQGGASRLHDRIAYTLTDNKSWKIERLSP
jgi:pyridoxamine 5'-phosphate oxidase